MRICQLRPLCDVTVTWCNRMWRRGQRPHPLIDMQIGLICIRSWLIRSICISIKGEARSLTPPPYLFTCGVTSEGAEPANPPCYLLAAHDYVPRNINHSVTTFQFYTFWDAELRQRATGNQHFQPIQCSHLQRSIVQWITALQLQAMITPPRGVINQKTTNTPLRRPNKTGNVCITQFWDAFALPLFKWNSNKY
jgi:hypothetical protein